MTSRRPGVPAARVVKGLGIHRNTVYRYHKLIRGRIAADRESELVKFELDSIVYSGGWKSNNKLSLNGFHHRRINHDKTLVDGKMPINGIESFQGYAK